jgi:phenylalanyl-tRNA synthetase alpha chain
VSDVPEITPEAVEAAVADALAAVAAAADTAALKQARAAHQGEGSPLATLNAQMRHVAKEKKAEAGKLVGAARGRVNQAFTAREEELKAIEDAEKLEAERLDITAIASRTRSGARHPVVLMQEAIADLFVGMGWEITEGPELEHEWFNFDSLNLDEDHPARQEQDTFYVDPASRHLVLRTQTSPVQMRTMLEREVPIYVLSPGKVARTDEFDATHLPVFTQAEGLVVDKGITMAHLKGGARWIEWGGCGMVNPNVLRAAGIDPEVYSGFAFGIGIERALMFRSDVQDMRDMAEGDVRFSEQFGMVV